MLLVRTYESMHDIIRVKLHVLPLKKGQVSVSMLGERKLVGILKKSHRMNPAFWHCSFHFSLASAVPHNTQKSYFTLRDLGQWTARNQRHCHRNARRLPMTPWESRHSSAQRFQQPAAPNRQKRAVIRRCQHVLSAHRSRHLQWRQSY